MLGASGTASASSGGLGGVTDLLSMGKTLWDGFSTGMSSSFVGVAGSTGAFMASGAGMAQASMLAAQTAEFGAAGTMMTTSALGGSSMVGAIGAAAPYIAGAIAIAGALGINTEE